MLSGVSLAQNVTSCIAKHLFIFVGERGTEVMIGSQAVCLVERARKIPGMSENICSGRFFDSRKTNEKPSSYAFIGYSDTR